MATITKTKSGTWRAEARVTKNRKLAFREIRHFDTKREASAWGEETEARVKNLLATGKTLPTDMTLKQAMEQWEADLKTFIEDGATTLQRKSKEYVALIKRTDKDVSRRKRWAQDARLSDRPLKSISQLDIELYIDDRRDDEIADSTIKNDLAILRQLYAHAGAASQACGPAGWKWALDCPIDAAQKDRKVKSSGQRDRRLGPDELEAIRVFFSETRQSQLNAPSTGRHWIEVKTSESKTVTLMAHESLLFVESAFEAAIECALRREKLFAMTWRWVDLTPGAEYLVIPPEMLGPANKGVPAHIPMSPRMVEIMHNLSGGVRRIGKALDEPVFGPLLADRAYRLLKIACDALGIDDFRWHDLRHEACSRLAEAGWTIAEIQQVSGHKSLQSLQRYIHINKNVIYKKMREEIAQQSTSSTGNQLKAIPNAINGVQQKSKLIAVG